mmetsp:Transcript_7984/g.35415  ORF Transcript_7984/g.35415 Transcript_7984/m.35415 type:complete len:96 (+) Transcript_7984:107-394(+)
MVSRTLIFDSSAFISNARMYNSDEGHYYGVLDGSSEAYAVPELTLEVRDALSRERQVEVERHGRKNIKPEPVRPLYSVGKSGKILSDCWNAPTLL